jgi:hypothetical protein
VPWREVPVGAAGALAGSAFHGSLFGGGPGLAGVGPVPSRRGRRARAVGPSRPSLERQGQPYTRPVIIPEAVRNKASATGPEGEQWLHDLPALVAELARAWQLRVGEAMPGGSAAFVAPAETATGEATILKLAMPGGLEGNSDFATELRCLRIGQGHGYVRLLASDEHHRALLLERLGPSLAELNLPISRQLEPEVCDDDANPLGGKLFGRSGADAVIGSRHDRHAPSETGEGRWGGGHLCFAAEVRRPVTRRACRLMNI